MLLINLLKTPIPLLLICVLLFSACSADYQEIDGELYYVKSTANGKINTKLIDVDKASFKILKGSNSGVLGNIYGKDKNHVYYKGQLIKDASANSFKILDNLYAKDKSNIFYKTETLAADLASFEILYSYYAKDKDQVFSQGKILDAVADAKSFELIKDDWTRDKHFYYMNNFRIEKADYETFKIINAHYAKDKNHVFYRPFYNRVDIVENADPATFRIGWYSNRGIDKNGCYTMGEPAKCD